MVSFVRSASVGMLPPGMPPGMPPPGMQPGKISRHPLLLSSSTQRFSHRVLQGLPVTGGIAVGLLRGASRA
ncbi:unnamed protein product [Pylaiella littoralis]